MPHYTTWGGTYVTRPVAREDRSPIQSDGDFNDVVFHSKQADSFMKLDDIRGEFTTGGGGDSFNSWRDVRDHNHGKVADALPNVAISCEDGDIRLEHEVDALTNYRPFSEMNQGDPFSELDQGVFAPVNVLRSDNSFNCDDILLGHGAVHPDMPMDTHPNDILLGFPGSGADALTNYRPEVFSEGVSSPAGYTDIIPAIALRSDNRFVNEPVNLFQGLDAGNALDSRLINHDDFLLMNKVINSLQPANEFI